MHLEAFGNATSLYKYSLQDTALNKGESQNCSTDSSVSSEIDCVHSVLQHQCYEMWYFTDTKRRHEKQRNH